MELGYKVINNTIVEGPSPLPSNWRQGKRVNGKLVWRKFVPAPQPSYNTYAERVEQSLTVLNDRVEEGWNVIPLSDSGERYTNLKNGYKNDLAQKKMIEVLGALSPTLKAQLDEMDAVPEDANIKSKLEAILNR